MNIVRKLLIKKKYKVQLHININMLEKLKEDFQSNNCNQYDLRFWESNLKEMEECLKYFPKYRILYDTYVNYFEEYKAKYHI
ncbi:hypothetical protein BFS06_11665 [Clostridium perfringens]|uniref:Uncharacterized protein n=1 Tax=Clostridium perfringens TaxID=1502 RepID=A0A140GS42_CLOPF|nr:hypothetical protein [Clostridium perfringens]AMN31351.1 hypothetical protein JFP838_pA0435 [Clostridium perfringens]TBX14870.1 hypothetical protein BFS06_11665 [Clostridium perfringens]